MHRKGLGFKVHGLGCILEHLGIYGVFMGVMVGHYLTIAKGFFGKFPYKESKGRGMETALTALERGKFCVYVTLRVQGPK